MCHLRVMSLNPLLYPKWSLVKFLKLHTIVHELRIKISLLPLQQCRYLGSTNYIAHLFGAANCLGLALYTELRFPMSKEAQTTIWSIPAHQNAHKERTHKGPIVLSLLTICLADWLANTSCALFTFGALIWLMETFYWKIFCTATQNLHKMVTVHLKYLENKLTLPSQLPVSSGIGKQARINPVVTKEQVIVYIQPQWKMFKQH